MKILVTGSAGFIGSHFCELMLKKGNEVIGLDNLNDFYDPDIKRENLAEIKAVATTVGSEFYFYEGDICQKDDVKEVLQKNKVDVIVHLAAMAGVRPSLQDPVHYVEVNALGSAILLETANKMGVRNFIFASSSSVYGNNKKIPFNEKDSVDLPISTYAATKKAGELLCHVYHEVYGMNIACLRFFTVYGPRQRPDLAINKFTHLMLNNRAVPVYGDGTKKRDFTYIDDIIDGIDRALQWVSASGDPRYNIFNLGATQTTDVNTLVKYLEKELKIKAQKEFLPDCPGDVSETFADISKASEILGYRPQTDIQSGIKKYIEWVITNNKWIED